MGIFPNSNDNLLLRFRDDDAGHEGFIMNQRLRDIQYTCPIYNNIVAECDEIRRGLSGPIEEDDIEAINTNLDCIISYADDIRNIAGDLRDAAFDIADLKNSKIEELKSRIKELDQLKSEEVC